MTIFRWCLGLGQGLTLRVESGDEIFYNSEWILLISGVQKTVDAERTYKGLLLYLKDNVAIPFTLPPKNTSADVDSVLKDADIASAEEREGAEAKAEAIEEEGSEKEAKDEL